MRLRSCGSDGHRAGIFLAAILAAQSVLPIALAENGPLAEEDALLNLSDQTLEDYTSGWYRTEVLIFVRDLSIAPNEDWDPLPALQYPEQYQHLIDPALAAQRLTDAGAISSAISASGIQQLTVPRQAGLLESVLRPDIDPTPELPPDPNAPIELLEGEPDAFPLDPNSGPLGLDPNQPIEEVLSRAIVALPYLLLPQDQLTFLPQARTLRRGGNDIVFHGSWWSPIAEESAAFPIVLDRSGDADTDSWPRLQGSIKLHRSRFLHADVNLWLNTEGGYLPDGWQIDPPPLTRSSVEALTLGGEFVNPWEEESPFDPNVAAQENNPNQLPELSTIEVSDGVAIFDASGDVSGAAGGNASDDFRRETNGEINNQTEPAITVLQDRPVPYPWRHAIVHTQSRRMRSGEIHYLDHPLIGVIIQVSPVDEKSLPLAAEDEEVFRAQHGIPSVSVILETDEEL